MRTDPGQAATTASPPLSEDLAQRASQDSTIANGIGCRSWAVTGEVLLAAEDRSIAGMVQAVDQVLVGIAESPAKVCQAEHPCIVG